MEEKKFPVDVEGYFANYIEIIRTIFTNPAGFYREMPKTGGLTEPLVFMVVMGVVAGLIRSVFGIFGLGMAGSFLVALASIILVPIFIAIFGFIGAGILFLIWKLMGSQEPFEVSFRCLAYATAISPVTAVLNIVPYIGPVIGILLMTYLLVIASVEVHQIQARSAWIVFGAIFAILAFSSVSSQIAARRMVSRLDAMQKSMGQVDKMTPEEAGKMMGEFLKGMEKGKQ